MNFFNTERNPINKENELIKINNKQFQYYLEPISNKEDILLPVEAETYLKVNKNIFNIKIKITQPLNDWRNVNDIIRITFKSLVETVKNQGYIIKDLAKELKSKVNMKELNPLLNLKADNSEVFKAINNLCTSIGNLPTISQFNDLNEEKVSKSEIIYYLKAKPSFEEIENLLEEKINKNEFNNKYEELNQNLEAFKKDILGKIDELVSKKEIKVIENKEKEIWNILDKKADNEFVFNSLKLKSDKNEINTILDNKLDKADLANILKLLEEKLNKEEFINYKKNQENELNEKNNNIDDTYLNIVKEISKRVQEMKKDINMRFEIINTDIEKLNEN